MILGPASRPFRPADDLARGYPGAMVDGPLPWLEITAVAAVATAVLVFVLLMISLSTRNRLVAIHREQLEELVRLREELKRARHGDSAADAEEVPRIGAPEPVFQIGDRVAIVDGPHSGDHGTVVPTPEWVRQGFVCVELLRERGKRYMPVSKLSRLDEPTRP
jgi:hypothetical protein